MRFGLIFSLIALPLFLLLAVSADANYRFAVIDANSGQVLISRGAKERRAPASLTKMMTTLVASDQLGPSQSVTVGGYRPRPDEQQLGLRRGEQMNSNDLIKAALVNSANDAAVALADHGGNRSRFLSQMNQKAQKLGLVNTHFKHPAGMDTPGQYSSAIDMARLGQALMHNRRLARIVSQPEVWLNSGREPRHLLATNQLLGGPIDGIKTGYTNNAGFSIVTSGHRGRRWVIASVLGASSSEERFAAADHLISRGLDMIQKRTIARRGAIVASMPVAYNSPAQIKLAKSVSIWTASKEPVRQRLIGLPNQIQGPMAAGSQVGRVEYYLGNKKQGQSPLILANALDKPSFIKKLLSDVPLLPLAIVILVAGSVFFFLERSATAAASKR